MIDNKEIKLIRVLWRLGLVHSYQIDTSINWRGGGDVRVTVGIEDAIYGKNY